MTNTTFRVGSRSWWRSSVTRRAATVSIALTLVCGVLSLSLSGPAASSVVRHSGAASTLRPKSGSPLVYTPGEFFGGSNDSAFCFTCTAAAVTGTAPPSLSLDAGSGVSALTGDFTMSRTLFDAPAFGMDLSFTLSYDAQLAQSEHTSGSAGPLGWGWTSNFQTSMTPQSGGSVSNQLVVNETTGAQDTFTQANGSCPSGDNPSSSAYTIRNLHLNSGGGWCALDNVQGQVGYSAGSELAYEVRGGQSAYEYAWNGTLSLAGSATSINSGSGSITPYYNVAPGTEVNTGLPNNQLCPSTAHSCTMFYAADGRVAIEALNSSGQVTQIVSPAGVTFNLSYDSHGNLIGVTDYANQTSPSLWNYVYDTSQASPDNSDLIQIYDPDSGVGASPPANPGAAHSTYVAYNNSGSDIGMVSSLEDGTGALTTYAYQSPCDQASCTSASGTQQTTITYPAQVPCPSCTAVSAEQVDSYTAGVETSTSLGSTTNPYLNETWSYSWSLGYGASSSVETITYPHSLLGGTGATATVTLDAEGSVIQTDNPNGDVATSVYTYTNNVPDLAWSYPGSSSNGPSNPPAGSAVYTYDQFGNILTAKDPVGNTTNFGYYATSLQLCYVAWPTATASSYPDCNGSGTSGPGTTPPTGSTAYTYDSYNDVTTTAVDFGDGSTTETTTASYDVMGNQLWTIPPVGQGSGIVPGNPYATVMTYTPSNLVATKSVPSAGTTTYTYDAALNLTLVQTPISGAYDTTVYDADNRPCYELTGSNQSGLTCTSAAQAGSTTTTYVPGTTTVTSSRDANSNVTSYYYGDLAYPSSATEVVDPIGTMIQYSAYDDYGNECVTGSVQPALGTSSQCSTLAGDTSKVFDALGNETSATDPSGNTTTNAFTNTAYPTMITSSVNALGQTTSYSYDSDGRLLTTTNPDLTSLTNFYDADSRLCASETSGNTGNCSTLAAAAGTTAYSYSGAWNRTSATVDTPMAGSTPVLGMEDGCALSGGVAQCWGQGTLGDLLTGNTSNHLSAVTASRLSGISQLSLGNNFTCGVTSGSVQCAGYNYYGQLGDGNTLNSTTPVSVSSLSGVTQVAASSESTCGLSSGAVYCWGAGTLGQLGNGGASNSSVPVQVSGISTATQLAGGSQHFCALLSSGTVKCWGYNSSGQLGNGTTNNASTPVSVSGLSGVTQIAAGGDFTCALLSAGTEYCWGADSYGQTGSYGFTSYYLTPVQVMTSYTQSLTGVTKISAGGETACAILTGGTVDCWGYGQDGEVGGASGYTNYGVATPVVNITGVTSVANGSDNTCGQTSSGLYCWGGNYSGELSNGTTTKSPTPVSAFASATTSYSYTNGQLTSTSDANAKTVTYLYGYGGQVLCIGYPVSSSTNCGSIGSPGTGSTTNTIVNYTYDSAGRLSTVKDWLGKTTTYAYGDAWVSYTPTSITYPSGTGLTATYGYDNVGNVTSLTAGSSISDSWTHDSNERVASTTINGSTSASATYNARNQVTGAANLATSTSNDTFSLAANGEMLSDTTPASAVTSFGYNAGAQLCWSANVTASSSACGSPPSGATVSSAFSYTANGQRASVTTTTGSGSTSTYYGWNPYGQLCSVATTATACGATPISGSAYWYNPDGLRVTTITPGSSYATTTASSWDLAFGGSTPLNLNDAATTLNPSPSTTNTSYVYGDLLLGGVAPIEQITTSGSTSTPVYLVANETGVQGVYSSTGASLEQAIYSPYGVAAITSGSKVTPFGFQGSYTDATGLIYLINRYYDPETDQFLSVDPLVDETDQPYMFVNSDPLNRTDPKGLKVVGATGTPQTHSSGVTCGTASSSSGYVLTGYSASPSDCHGGPLASGSVLNSNSTAAQARAAAESSGYPIPKDYVAERAANGKGWIFRPPGSQGNADTIRVAEPNSRNPTGYVRYYNSEGQPVTGPDSGQTGSGDDTHLPLGDGDGEGDGVPFVE